MPVKVVYGARCVCGRIIPVQGVEQDAPISLEDLQRKLMLEGWQRIVIHGAPGGCGRGVPGVCTPDKLVIYGTRRADGSLLEAGAS